jgi:hypothetical protein
MHVCFFAGGARTSAWHNHSKEHTQHKGRNLSLETGKGVVVILTRRSRSLSSTQRASQMPKNKYTPGNRFPQILFYLSSQSDTAKKIAALLVFQHQKMQHLGGIFETILNIL